MFDLSGREPTCVIKFAMFIYAVLDSHILYSLAIVGLYSFCNTLLLSYVCMLIISQILTVPLWMALKMGEFHSLEQHTIQWPLTPVTLAMV